MRTYHYHAMAQVANGTVHIDGVTTRKRPIITGEDYDEFKQSISDFEEARGQGFGGARKLTICSLTVLA